MNFVPKQFNASPYSDAEYSKYANDWVAQQGRAARQAILASLLALALIFAGIVYAGYVQSGGTWPW